MKKGIIVSLSIVVIVVVVLLTNSLKGITILFKNQELINNGYLITEKPEYPDFNGHSKSGYRNYDPDEEEKNNTPWSYQVNELGIRNASSEFYDELFSRQRKLAYNEYHCMILNDKPQLTFPSEMEFAGENIDEIAKELDLDQLKIKGYKLIAISGDYEYMEDEIVFEEGKTQTLEIEMSRFYPKNIAFENNDQHRITIRANNHSDFACSAFYHEDMSEYLLLKTEHLDWWIFDRMGMSSLISFQGKGANKYDLTIREGIVRDSTNGSILHQGWRPIWGKDYSAFKEVLDQLGNLSQLNTKSAGWSSSFTNGSEPVTVLRIKD